MDVIPLLLPLFVLPGADALEPLNAEIRGDSLVIQRHVGEGHEVVDGDLVTVHYTLSQDGGKDLANTVLRGLPYSFPVGGTAPASPLVEAVRGMRPGESRLVFFRSERLVMPDDPQIPKDADLVLSVKLIRSRSVKLAKVNSADARRTQGTLAVPGAPRQHGPARP